MQAVFIHGGPGLNSHAEEVLLKDSFKKEGIEIIFWNEPRSFQTQNPYSEILDSIINTVNNLNDEVLLIGHSSGCKNILNILPQIKDKVKGVCLLSPALDFNEADKNIIEKGLEIFKQQDQQMFKKLTELYAEVDMKVFDEKRIEAVLTAFGSNYFPENFNSQESFENYFSHLQGEFEFRINDYLSIRKSIPAAVANHTEALDVPTVAIFGKNDPIFDFTYGKKIIEQFFTNSESICLDNVSHYPHIDATDLFFSKLKELI